jgi:lipopolysaccharide export system permease protein
MKVYQRYLAKEIYSAVGLVLAAFLMLFAFFDFINELQSLGRGNYQLRYMALFVLLTLPGHIYELAPIAVLIGTLYALTMLARHSEITVLRASGLSTGMILGRAGEGGAGFRAADLHRRRFRRPPGRAGRQAAAAAGDGSGSGPGVPLRPVGQGRHELHQRAHRPAGFSRLEDVRIYEFDKQHVLRSISEARRRASTCRRTSGASATSRRRCSRRTGPR